MRVLFVSQAYPDPNGRGFERRAAQHLSSLKKLGEVTLVIPGKTAANTDVAALDPITLGVARVIVRSEPTLADTTQARHALATTKATRFLHAIRRRYDCDQSARPIDRNKYRMILTGEFDLVFAFRIGSAIWIESVLDMQHHTRRIVDFDDIESVALARNSAGHQKSFFWRWKVRNYISHLARVENRLAKQWPLTLVCSQHDARLLCERGHRAHAVPNAFQFEEAAPERASSALQILFVGTLSYRPNVDGITWFVQNVWPALQQRLQGKVNLKIVGFDPPPEIRALGAINGIEVAGPVNALKPVYAASNISIVPVFSGSGTRIKILEAFAFARAVVTTPIGCEGLDLINGHHAMVAESADEFIEAIVQLARSRDKRRTIARAGQSFGSRNFSTSVVEAQFERLIAQMMGAQVGRHFLQGRQEVGGFI